MCALLDKHVSHHIHASNSRIVRADISLGYGIPYPPASNCSLAYAQSFH